MKDDTLMKAQKKSAVIQASRDVDGFVSSNKDIFKETIKSLCAALNDKEIEQIGKLSYQLCNMAPLFSRHDMANMADFLFKILKDPGLSNKDAVYELFYDSFLKLNSVDKVDEVMEQKILIKTRNTLAELRKS